MLRGLSAVGMNLLRVWIQQLHTGEPIWQRGNTAIDTRDGDWKTPQSLLERPGEVWERKQGRATRERFFQDKQYCGGGEWKEAKKWERYRRDDVTWENLRSHGCSCSGLLPLCKSRLRISGKDFWEQEIRDPPRHEPEWFCAWKDAPCSEPHLCAGGSRVEEEGVPRVSLGIVTQGQL